MDIIRRKLILVTIGIKGLNELSLIHVRERVQILVGNPIMGNGPD